MDMQGALRSRLLGATAAATRVYWMDRPQASTLPAITLQTVTGERPQTYGGFQDTRFSRVQMDIWATSYAEARAILEAAVAAIAPRIIANGITFDRMQFEGERDLLERLETQTIYRTSIDLMIWHTTV